MNKYVNLTDDELVRLYQAGENEAFDALLMRYEEYIHTYIRFSIADEAIIEDVFQEVFIKVMTVIRAGKYNAQGRFKQWISRITHNKVIDYFRQDKRDLYIVEQDTVERIAPENDELNAEERMLKQDNDFILKGWVSELSLEQQEILKLRYWDDLSFKEIADELGISINTALGRVRYALKNLRKKAEENPLDIQ